jgi:hypothetical protein
MTLTDTRIRNAKPSAKACKLSDGGGMYLLVTPDGARYWRLDYRFAGKRRTLALGVYPIVTLSSAARGAKKRELCWRKTLIRARRRRRPNVLQSSHVTIRSRLLRGNGSTISAID